jgi:hypothetical protein
VLFIHTISFYADEVLDMVVTVFFSSISHHDVLFCLNVSAFTMSDLEQFLDAVVPLSVWIGIISLTSEICMAFFRYDIDDNALLLEAKLRDAGQTSGCYEFMPFPSSSDWPS